MGKRRRAREAAIQYHFWRDLQHGDGPEKIGDFWEFCPATPRVREFAQPLIEGMVAHLPEIDERIRRYCENYEFRRISAVDRNILRLAIYEMLYRDDIPPVVSINEAIELAKTFGGGESGKFVNGILDRVRKDLTRPAQTNRARSASSPRRIAPCDESAWADKGFVSSTSETSKRIPRVERPAGGSGWSDRRSGWT